MDKKYTLDRKIEIKRLLIKNREIIKKFGIRKIGLFGSVVNGQIRSGSDIDILVEFEKENERYTNLIGLYFFLQTLFGKKIDLITSNGISPYIGPYIFQEVEYIEELS